MRRTARVLAILAAWGLACIAPAAAWPATTVLDIAPEMGPAQLAGKRAVWVRPEAGGERLLERRAGATRTVAVLPPRDAGAGPLEVSGMDASDSLIAVERKAGEVRQAGAPARPIRKTFEIVGRDRRVRRLSDCPGVRCACREADLLDFITPFDVDGDRLFYGGLECQRRGTRVLDFGTAPASVQRLPEARRAGLRAAGRYLAWGSEKLGETSKQFVAVYDRHARRLAYRWEPPARIADRVVALDWDVDAAGRLAVSYTYATSGDDRNGFGLVDRRTGRLRELGREDAGARWNAPGRLMAVRERQLLLYDVRTGRSRRVPLGARRDRYLEDADDRCLLYRTVRRPAPGTPEPSVTLEVQPVPGSRPSPLCPR